MFVALYFAVLITLSIVVNKYFKLYDKNSILLKDNLEIKKESEELNIFNKRMEETNRTNVLWYITQMHELGIYLKYKHKDDYILNILRTMPQYDKLNLKSREDEIQNKLKEVDIKEPIVLDMDVILDKINEIGFDKLSEEEKNYLKNISF